MASQGVRAGRAFVELFADDNQLTRGLMKASRKLQAWGASISRVGTKISTKGMVAASAGAGVLAGLFASSKAFADTGSQLNDMNARTGVSAEELSLLKFAAEQSGASIEDLETAIKKMQKGLVAGDAVFAQLGLSAADLAKQDPGAAFTRVGEAIAAIENPTKRSAMAMLAFGKAGTSVLPMLDGLAAKKQEALDAGLGWTDEDVRLADSLGDSIDKLKNQFSRLVQVVGATLAPAFMDLFKSMVQPLKAAMEWVRANAGLASTILKVAGIVTAIGAVMMVIGPAISAIGSLLAITGSVVKVLSFFVGVPGIILAIAAGIATLAGGLTVIKQSWAEIGRIAQQGLGTFMDALKSGDILSAMKVLWAGIKDIWYSGIAALKIGWYSFLHGLNGRDYSEPVIAALKDAIDAKKAYAQAISDAQSKFAGGVIGSVMGGTLQDVSSRMPKIGQAVAAMALPEGASRGTTNSFAALRMPGGGNVPQRTLDKISELLKVSQDQLAVMRDNNLRFN